MSKPINISIDATVLTTLMACPRKMDLRFNRNLEELSGKSNALECGSLVHIILEYFNKSIIAGKNRNDSIDIGFAAGKEYIVPYNASNNYVTDPTHRGMLKTNEENDKWNTGWRYVLETMVQYFDYYKNDDSSFTTIAAEETRGRMLYEDSEVRIFYKAKFDAIVDHDKGTFSKDYKTMKQNRPTNDMSNQFMGHCFILGTRSVIIDKIGFQTSLPLNEKFQRKMISYSSDRIAEWVNDIVPFYARMLHAYTEAENFPPNFTQCESKFGKCEYLNICSNDRTMRDDIAKQEFIIGKAWDV